MINNNERLITYLHSLINKIFKILPMYEEGDAGLKTYIESLLFRLYSLEKTVMIKDSYEYISLLSILESIKREISKEGDRQPVIKREIFNCINVIKNMLEKLENGE